MCILKSLKTAKKIHKAKSLSWNPPPFGPFLAKYDPQTPQKAQNSEKAHWHDWNRHVYGPFEGGDRSQALQAFSGIWIFMKNRWIWWNYIGSPLWNCFWNFFEYFFYFFENHSKNTQQSYAGKFKVPEWFFGSQKQVAHFYPTGCSVARLHCGFIRGRVTY